MKTKQTINELLSKVNTVEKVNLYLEKNETTSRTGLAKYLCEELNLYDPLGNPRLSGVLKTLRDLESKGYWELPATKVTKRKDQKHRRLDKAVAPAEGVPQRVEAVKGLELIEVNSKDDELFRIWNELMLTEHPLQEPRLVGCQMRYLIKSDHGWLGGIGFGSCVLRMRMRDQWIGWDVQTRKMYQERVIGMRRFLIRPQVNCQNLASRVLSLCAERLGRDYKGRYGFEPWLIETFVDSEQYSGTCYQASNWHYLGKTVGRGRSGFSNGVISCKHMYIFELNREWRKKMKISGPHPHESIPSISVEEALNNETWVEDEFNDVDLGYKRMNKRLVQIATAKALNPMAPYTECFSGNRHELKSYYRFIGNDVENNCPEGILQGHRQRTLGRMKSQKRVLVLQDTTDLDFSKRLHCNGLGGIGKNQTGVVNYGLKMHSALVVEDSGNGLPLGVLNTELYSSDFGSKKKSTNRPIQEKESYRWLKTMGLLSEVSMLIPGTELICVGDRESDIFELFDLRRRKAPAVHLIVRSQYNRCLEDKDFKLFQHLDTLPVMGEARISIPRQREKKGTPSKPGRISVPAREAIVQLKWDKVRLSAPDTKQTRHLKPMEVYVMTAFESEPPKGAKPICWTLLTTLPVQSSKQALRCLRRYARRWRIEEWHRVLKSGCKVEAHQNRTANRLARAIAIDAVIAWRVMLLALLGRQTPQIPCELVFSSWECRLLEILQKDVAPETICNPQKNSI
jgi:hypothetical protein